MADEVSPDVIAHARPRSRIPDAWLDEIERRLLAAEAPNKFVPVLAKTWERSKRRVWGYVARVRARLAARATSRTPEVDREVVRAMALESYECAKSGSKKFGPDVKGMVAATKIYAEITGVIGPRKVELSGPAGGPIVTEAVVRVVELPELEPEDAGAVAPESGPTDTLPRE